MLASLTPDQLHIRFFQEACPHWVAYEATGKQVMVAKFRDDDPSLTDEEKMDYAWLQMEELFQNFSYGKMKVVFKSSSTSNNAKSPTVTVEWGELPMRGAQGNHNFSNNVGVGNANSMGGNNWQMIQFFLQQQNETTKALHAAQMEALRLNMENQNLAAALEDNSAPSTQELLLKEGIGVVKTWVASNATRPAVMAGTMGQRTEEAPAVEAAPSAGQNDGFTIDGCVNITHAITNLWPQYPRMAIMNAFYKLATDNKEFIGAQLQMILENEQR